MRASLHKPVFLVGYARAGSTLLAAILNTHPDIGPKPQVDQGFSERTMSSLLDYTSHLAYSQQLEQKDVWFSHLGGEHVFTHMGKELHLDETHAPRVDRNRLLADLTTKFAQRRFLSKAPTNTFRVRLLNTLFPGAKFIVLYRTGEEVVASWGSRPYGFGCPVDWGQFRVRRLGYFQGIRVFSRKWQETIEAAESCVGAAEILRLTYRQLIQRTDEVLDALTDFLELDSPLRSPERLEVSRLGGRSKVIPSV